MLRRDVQLQLRAAKPSLATLCAARTLRVGEPSGVADLPAHMVAAELPERLAFKAQTGRIAIPVVLEAAEKGAQEWQFSGYSCAYGVVFWGRWGYQQVVEAGALDKCMTAEGFDCVLVGIDHDGPPHARTIATGETRRLHLSSDDYGQKVEARIPMGDASGDMIRERIEAGVLTEMSLVATIVDYEWGGGDYSVQRITELDQNRGDVSIVVYGMNPETMIGMPTSVSATAVSTESLPPSDPPPHGGSETEIVSDEVDGDAPPDGQDIMSLRAELKSLEMI